MSHPDDSDEERFAPVRLVAIEEPFAANVVDFVQGGILMRVDGIERRACEHVQKTINDALAVL